jgi:hypothetical protein
MTTKSELAAQLAACRRELAERRRVGAALANMTWNLHHCAKLGPYTLTMWEAKSCDDLTREWDAIAREGGEGGG